MLVMFDSVDNDIPASAQAIAGYTSGNWPTWNEPWFQQHKAAHKLSIAIFATHNALALDMENGDALLSEGPDWTRRQQARSIWRPVLYSSISNMVEVVGLMSQHGFARSDYRLWAAHYGLGPHICGHGGCPYTAVACDATQWTSSALGRNLDESLCLPDFFQFAKPTPVPVDPNHYLRFDKIVRDLGDTGRKASERQTVIEYDRDRARWLLFPGRLKRLRDNLGLEADRLENVMHDDPAHNAEHDREWRHAGLRGRAGGKRYV